MDYTEFICSAEYRQEDRYVRQCELAKRLNGLLYGGGALLLVNG